MAQKQDVIPAQQQIFKWERAGHKPTFEELKEWNLLPPSLAGKVGKQRTRRKVFAPAAAASQSGSAKSQSRRTVKKNQGGSK